ncbi:MAG TPA: VWA domain-containing protein [Vicinamibacterales bacterium]|jgi:Ca-activated chloride channel family protein
MIGDLHFLRPWWLCLLAAPIMVFLLQRMLDRQLIRGDGLIAPHLLRHLLVPRGKSRGWRPSHFTMAALALGAVALAGPAWQHEETPFTRDESPLVIALELSQTMDAVDVEPTRLERGKQKIRDLLALRSNAKTAIVVYAETAHLVLPLTADPGVGGLYLDALATDLMPRPGNNPQAALAIARRLLERESVPGSVLFVTDGIPRDQLAAFDDFTGGSSGLMVLGVGTDAGGPIRIGDNRYLTRAGRPIVAPFDAESLRLLARDSDAYVGTFTVDGTDVARLQRRARTQIERAGDASGSARWKDEGYLLVPVIALLTLVSFRRGWTMQWAALWLLVLLPASAKAQTGGTPAQAAADAPRTTPPMLRSWQFIDLWLTPDQQGRRAFDRGDYREAAAHFRDPEWRGIACYRAGDFSCAVDAFVRVQTADGAYNLGNAYVQLKSWQQAADAYRNALAERPGFRDAKENLDLVLDVLRRIEEEKKQQEQEQGVNLKPDEVKFDDKGKKGKKGLVDQSQAETAADIWLRGLQMTPAGFLKMKFAIQADEATGAKRPQ